MDTQELHKITSSLVQEVRDAQDGKKTSLPS